ncbi:MAG: FHA domain-containing protein [Cellvibrionaceae bacterium]|nr:FHA domain-containing protein [Cellvibrionaceae bacterium]MCV6628169.1 FHA domain-containing protein [Cellvibrionaceae bacterium]
MASLYQTNNGSICHLLPHHTFGRRADKVDTHLSDPQVSKIHASIEWDGRDWLLKDLSLNGVWLDGEKITAQQAYPLKPGQLIQFVSPELRFKVQDLSPPGSYLVPGDSGQPIVALQKLHLLPDEDSPLAALQLCNDSHQWQLDIFADEGEPINLQHGQIIELGDRHWTLQLSENTTSPTLVMDKDQALDNYCFVFNTSADEENTGLSLSKGQKQVDLGDRSHHYVLLHLARQRGADNAEGLNEFDQGWVDNSLLVKELGMELAHINIQLYRLRKQLTDTMPDLTGISKMVERKRGKLRFGKAAFRIYKSGQLEVEKTSA